MYVKTVLGHGGSSLSVGWDEPQRTSTYLPNAAAIFFPPGGFLCVSDLTCYLIFQKKLAMHTQ